MKTISNRWCWIYWFTYRCRTVKKSEYDVEDMVSSAWKWHKNKI